MSESNLILHCGAHEVDRAALARALAPQPTRTWFPLSHLQVVERVEQTLHEAGFTVARSRYALSRGEARFFGVMDLESMLAGGVRLAIGVRNSTDKSLPIGFCAGHRVMVCDNLAFRSEVTIARKHTRFGEQRFAEALSRAIGRLPQFRSSEAARIARFQTTDVEERTAESLMLRAYEKAIVSHRLLPRVIREWRGPSFEAFRPRTLWSLLNAFTTVLAGRMQGDPQTFARLSIQLSDLISDAAGVRPEEQILLSA